MIASGSWAMITPTNGTRNFAFKPEITSTNALTLKRMETSIDALISCTLTKCGVRLTSEESTRIIKGRKTTTKSYMILTGLGRLITINKPSNVDIIPISDSMTTK